MLVLYQPDIPQNVGTLLRLGACLGVPVHIIEPCGFLWGERRLRRSGMDYLDKAQVQRHENWDSFCQWRQDRRLILLTPQGDQSYLDLSFTSQDLLLLGQESCGVPEEVAQACDLKATIPMKSSFRSLNVAISGAIVMGEVLRQTQGFPSFPGP